MGGRRRIFLLGTLATTALFGAPPVFANTELGHAGTVGAHSLVDTAANPAAMCGYKDLPAYDEAKLKVITVTVPKMKAVAGKSSQLVGFQVIVQRKYGSIYTNNPWLNKFTSAETTATTNDATNAYFGSSPTISVTVPYGPISQDVYALYRVVLKLIWHKPNGSVQGTALHRVDHYGTYVLGILGTTPQPKKCYAYLYY